MESVSYTDVCCMCHSCPQNQYDFNVASLAKSKTERSMVSRCAFIAEREGPWCVCVCVIAEKDCPWSVCVCHSREGRSMVSVCVIAEKEGA